MLLQGKISDQELNTLNTKIRDYYGSMGENLPRYRVVYANDEMETKVVSHTPEGLQLLYPEIRKTKKYWNWAVNKYVLEAFSDTPEGSGFYEKYSYEPLFTFEDALDRPLYPDWRVIRNVIETVRHNMEHGVAKYIDPLLEPESAKEEQAKSVNRIYEEYYGNESDITDSLMLGSGVSLSGPKKEN